MRSVVYKLLSHCCDGVNKIYYKVYIWSRNISESHGKMNKTHNGDRIKVAEVAFEC